LQTDDGTMLAVAEVVRCDGCDGSCSLAFVRPPVALPVASVFRPGQAVVITVPRATLRHAAAIAFGLPLLGMVTAGLAAVMVGAAEPVAIGGVLAGLAVGVAVALRAASQLPPAAISVRGLDTEPRFVNNGALCDPQSATVSATAREPIRRAIGPIDVANHRVR
jgi:hypothetical protein